MLLILHLLLEKHFLIGLVVGGCPPNPDNHPKPCQQSHNEVEDMISFLELHFISPK